MKPTKPTLQSEPNQGNSSIQTSGLTLEPTSKPKPKSGLTRDELIEHRDMLMDETKVLRMQLEAALKKIQTK